MTVARAPEQRQLLWWRQWSRWDHERSKLGVRRQDTMIANLIHSPAPTEPTEQSSPKDAAPNRSCHPAMASSALAELGRHRARPTGHARWAVSGCTGTSAPAFFGPVPAHVRQHAGQTHGPAASHLPPALVTWRSRAATPADLAGHRAASCCSSTPAFAGAGAAAHSANKGSCSSSTSSSSAGKSQSLPSLRKTRWVPRQTCQPI